jgi:hypothetical protein
MKYRIEDILEVPDPDLQLRISRAKDLIIAAALEGAPGGVKEKIVRNISPRRYQAVREIQMEYGRFPQRTRYVAQRVLVKLAFGIEDEETRAGLTGPSGAVEKKEVKPISKKEYRQFIQKMLEQNPDFREAREIKKSVGRAFYIRRLIQGQDGA